MTLLELLRQELPKRGGWPEGVNFIAQDNGGSVWGFVHEPEKDEDDEWMEILRTGTHKLIGHLRQVSDRATAIVTREQYEATGWDGTGLPPVGCECEVMKPSIDTPKRVKIIAHFQNNAAMVAAYIPAENKYKTVGQAIACCFRPLRAEAERKRYAALEPIFEILDAGVSTSQDAIDVYDAIAAGKIPGVKLEV